MDFNLDISVSALVLTSDSYDIDVEVSFCEDNVALENIETATLVLEPFGGDTVPTGDGIFFHNEIEINIIDSDGM